MRQSGYKFTFLCDLGTLVFSPLAFSQKYRTFWQKVGYFWLMLGLERADVRGWEG